MLTKKFKEWQELNQLRDKANDHTRCPVCNDQLYFCDCVAWLAQEILMIFEKENK